MITDALWIALSRYIRVYGFKSDSLVWRRTAGRMYVVDTVTAHLCTSTTISLHHSYITYLEWISFMYSSTLTVDPTPDQRQRSWSKNTGGEGKHECADCERVNRTLAKCRRTPCLTADLIVLKEHLCVAVKSSSYLAWMPSVSAGFLLERKLQPRCQTHSRPRVCEMLCVCFPSQYYPESSHTKSHRNI